MAMMASSLRPGAAWESAGSVVVHTVQPRAAPPLTPGVAPQPHRSCACRIPQAGRCWGPVPDSGRPGALLEEFAGHLIPAHAGIVGTGLLHDHDPQRRHCAPDVLLAPLRRQVRSKAVGVDELRGHRGAHLTAIGDYSDVLNDNMIAAWPRVAAALDGLDCADLLAPLVAWFANADVRCRTGVELSAQSPALRSVPGSGCGGSPVATSTVTASWRSSPARASMESLTTLRPCRLAILSAA